MGILKVKLKLGAAVVATSVPGEGTASQQRDGGRNPKAAPVKAKRKESNKKSAKGSGAGASRKKRKLQDTAGGEKPSAGTVSVPGTSGQPAENEPSAPSISAGVQEAPGATESIDRPAESASMQTEQQQGVLQAGPNASSGKKRSKTKAPTIKLPKQPQQRQEAAAETKLQPVPLKASKLEVKVKLPTPSKAKAADVEQTGGGASGGGAQSSPHKQKPTPQKQPKPKRPSKGSAPTTAPTSGLQPSMSQPSSHPAPVSEAQQQTPAENKADAVGEQASSPVKTNSGLDPAQSSKAESEVAEKNSKKKSTPSSSKAAAKIQPRPPGPPKKDLLRIVKKIQEKDEYQIFGDPVTEEMAPGYFDVVSRPMDFLTVRNNINAGEYGSWEELQDDLMLMFDNAMAYNGPETFYHQVALTMKDLAERMVELGKQGVQCFRGRTAAIMRAHNAAQRNAVLEALEAEAADKAEEAAFAGENGHGFAIDFGVTRKGPGRPPGSTNAFKDLPAVRPGGEDYRHTYSHSAIGAVSANVCIYAGIANGATTEGVAFGGGRQSMQQVQMLSEEVYALSICRFMPGLKGVAREMVMKRLAS